MCSFSFPGFPCSLLVGVHLSESIHGQDYEHAHQHVHPQHNGSSKEHDAGMKHQKCCGAFISLELFLCPTVHYPACNKGWNQAQQEAQKKHGMASEDLLEQHCKPEIQWRFVCVSFTVVVEGQEIPVFKSVIHDVEVPELICRSEFPLNHQGEQHGKDEKEYDGSSFHDSASFSFFFCLWSIIRFLE